MCMLIVQWLQLSGLHKVEEDQHNMHSHKPSSQHGHDEHAGAGMGPVVYLCSDWNKQQIN